MHKQVAVTLDLTLFFKMASSQEGTLTQEELLTGRPNSRVFTLNANDPKNPVGRKIQFFSVYSPIRVEGALPIVLYNGVWHQISKNLKLGNAAPGVHDYNIQSKTSKEKGKSLPDTEDDINESLQKAIDQSIRESPLAPNMILPPWHALILDIPKMSTITAPTETIAFMKAVPTKEEQVTKAFGKAMKKYSPPFQPPGGGNPGGGGSLGGARALTQALAANIDIWPIGSPPSIFHGDRALVDNFLDKLNLYFQVNWAVPNYQSYITWAAFALTYIKGEEVAEWVRDFGEFLHILDPVNNDGPIVWEHFLDSFHERFQDLTKENWA